MLWPDKTLRRSSRQAGLSSDPANYRQGTQKNRRGRDTIVAVVGPSVEVQARQEASNHWKWWNEAMNHCQRSHDRQGASGPRSVAARCLRKTVPDGRGSVGISRFVG